MPGNNRDLIRVVEQCAGGCPDNGGGIAGLVVSRAELEYGLHVAEPVAGAASYVTGAHNMKVGYQGVFHWNTSYPTPTTTTWNTGSTTACRTS